MKKQYRTITKKLKWYNKLLVSIKEKFAENLIYSTELANRLSMTRFIWSQKIIILFLILPVVLLPIIAFFMSKQDQANTFFEINVFNVIAVVLTYAMPSFLSFIVWHSSWLQKREKENESAIRVYAEIVMNKNNTYLFYTENKKVGIKICFTNQNPDVPIKIQYLRTFHQEKGDVTAFSHFSWNYKDESKLLAFNETESFLIGFDEECFEKQEHLYFVFYLSNAYGHEVYCVVKCAIDESGWVSTIGNEAVLIDRNVFKKLKNKYGYYFLKEIVWWSPAGYKKKMINRVYMCKKVKVKTKATFKDI